MTAQQKARIKNIVGVLMTAALPALGWGLMRVDTRYVHTDEYKLHQLADSMHSMADKVQDSITNHKLDDVITRLREFKCGPDVIRGCR